MHHKHSTCRLNNKIVYDYTLYGLGGKFVFVLRWCSVKIIVRPSFTFYAFMLALMFFTHLGESQRYDSKYPTSRLHLTYTYKRCVHLK